jgi:hypothetical protein
MIPDTCAAVFAKAYRIQYRAYGTNPQDSDLLYVGTPVRVMDTPTVFTMSDYTALEPGPMGAILNGKMIGCSGQNQGDSFTGGHFTVVMWVMLPDAITEQYLFSDVMLHADGDISERFAISVKNNNLWATANDASTSALKVGVSGVDPVPVSITSAIVEGGWNLICITLKYDGTDTTVSTRIFSEDNGTTVLGGPTTIIFGAPYVDSSEYMTCLGASVEYTGTYDGKKGMSGTFR